MKNLIRRAVIGVAAVAVTAAGSLAVEPALRATQRAEANTDWQLVLGNEGAWCEGCCWALCCSLSAECRLPID
jgi:hypothetical protein